MLQIFIQAAKKPNNMSTHARVLVSEASTTGQDVHKYSHISPVTNPLPSKMDLVVAVLDVSKH